MLERKLFMLSICALRHVEGSDVEMAHGNGLIISSSESEAREKSQTGALERWSVSEGWTGHDVAIKIISRDTLRDVLGMLPDEAGNASGDRELTELLM